MLASLRVVLGPLTVLAAACAAAPPRHDGTIVLMLRAEGPMVMGDALLRYPPGDKDYENVKKHIGGLEPGQSKAVPPWPDR
jgi:hypothetical protein